MAENQPAVPPSNANLGLLANTGFGDLPTGAQIGMIIDTLRGGNSLWNFMAQSGMAQKQLDYQRGMLFGQPGQVTTPDDPGDQSAPAQPATTVPTGQMVGGLLAHASPDMRSRAQAAIMNGNGANFINEMTALPKLGEGHMMTPQGIVVAPGYLNAVQGKSLAEQMGKDYRMIGPDGSVMNMPGAVQAGAQVAGGNAGAVANAQQPFELQKIGARGQEERRNIGAQGQEERQNIQYRNMFEPMTAIVNGVPTQVPRAVLPQMAATGGLQTDYTPEQKSIMEGTGKANAEMLAQMPESFQALQSTKQRLDDMAAAFKRFQSGPLAPSLGEANAVMDQLGFPRLSKVDPDAVNIVFKNGMGNIIDQMKSIPGNRPMKIEIENFAKANASAGNTPQANQEIISQGAGLANRSMDWMQAMNQARLDASKSMKPFDPQAFTLQWMKEHPTQSYIDNARKSYGYAPPAGHVEGGYKFNGGNPADPNSWTKVQ